MRYLLVVDDDPDLLTLLSLRLKANGLRTGTAISGEQALSMIAAERPDLVITDLRMAGLDGMALFHEIERRYSGLPVIILTAHGTIPDAVAATQQGVFGYITKPYDATVLMAQISRALSMHGGGLLAKSGRQIDSAWCREIISRSPLMAALLIRTERVAQGDASVLIQGESGTGKEVLARALHRASQRADKPFVAVNCAAIPETLLESELFGHKKGAFTGATSDHPGLFLEADSGTLLLDEIGDMPLALQVKLLRVLEAREVRALGTTKTTPVNVRVISASHRDLNEDKAHGRFREDLYYRLNVVTLKLPPLRERREDIPLLLSHFLKTLAAPYERSVSLFSPDALQVLCAAQWPGNIRQLFNVAEQCVALSSGGMISRALVAEAMQNEIHKPDSLEAARRHFDYNYLTRLLTLTEGNVTQAAKLAKRNRTEFYKLLQRHAIEAAHFKPSND